MDLPRVGVGVLIFNQDQHILLGKRKNSLGAGLWCTPGGHLEYGESFEECGRREVFEETGLCIAEPKFLYTTNDLLKQEQRHYISIFLCVPCPENQVPIVKEPDKAESWNWFDLKNLPENLFFSLINFTKILSAEEIIILYSRHFPKNKPK